MTAAWTPDDALVEKAARAACIEACLDNSSEQACEFCKRHQMWTAYAAEARAALIACRDDMVAEAVKAERERCLTLAKNAHGDSLAEKLLQFVQRDIQNGKQP